MGGAAGRFRRASLRRRARAGSVRRRLDEPAGALQYGATPGEPELREAAARHLSRHLPTTPDQVLVTSGSQEGIYLSAQALLSPGDVVLVEEPTYLAAVRNVNPEMPGARAGGGDDHHEVGR